jgi:hypothetical protein
MSKRIRKARLEDIAGMMAVKVTLPMPRGVSTTQGGFLLGTSEEQYGRFIAYDQCLVLEDVQDQKVVGFAIVMGDQSLRKSELWQKQAIIQWDVPFEPEILDRSLCYFEQLAILPVSSCRYYAALLAYESVRQAIANGAELLFTTVVHYPIQNQAVLSFLNGAGARKVGKVPEVYPAVGALVSSLYMLRKQDFLEQCRQSPMVKRLLKSRENVVSDTSSGNR